MDSLRRVSSNNRLPFTIPDCLAVQVISDKEAPLSKGDLTLQLPTVTSHRASSIDSSAATSPVLPSSTLSPPPPSSSSSTYTATNLSSSSTNTPPILLAFVGKTLFPLYKTTNFGTFVNHPRQYAFDFRLSENTFTQVRLVLPDNIKQSIQDEFEDILIERGLLLKGIRAAGDEIMRGAKEGGKANSNWMAKGTQSHVSNSPSAGNNPMIFSKKTFDNAASLNTGSNTLYQYALGASNAVASAAESAGAGIQRTISSLGESVPASIKSENTQQQQESGEGDMSDMRKALNEAASGVSEGVSNVASTAQDSASKAISHSFGEDANTLASSAGDSLKQIGKTAANVAHSTSIVGASASAAKGASNESAGKEETSKGEHTQT